MNDCLITTIAYISQASCQRIEEIEKAKQTVYTTGGITSIERIIDLCSNTSEPSDRYIFGCTRVVRDRDTSELQNNRRRAAFDLTQYRTL